MKNILIVEDEEIIGFLHSKHIQSLGNYRTFLVSEADEYLNRLKNKDIDLVLMDVQLGLETDGVDLAKLGLQYHDAPVVFVTGDVESVPPSVIESEPAYKGVLPKPLRKENILELFEKLSI